MCTTPAEEPQIMKRLTTDNPQTEEELLLNLCQIEDNEPQIEEASKDGEVNSLPEFFRSHICDIDYAFDGACGSFPLSRNHQEVYNAMKKCTNKDCHIASAYFGLTQAAIMRERLKAYEDMFERWGLGKLPFNELEKWHERGIQCIVDSNKLETLLRTGVSFDRLLELAKADAEQRAVILLCKVGEKCYVIKPVNCSECAYGDRFWNAFERCDEDTCPEVISEEICDHFEIYRDNSICVRLNHSLLKTDNVYLTREAAEAELVKRNKEIRRMGDNK